jgi:phosphoglycolate phosphatase
MDCRAILFDLDGTLLDTLEDLAHAGNRTLEHFGFPTHAVKRYRYLIGEGVEVLFLKALPPKHRGRDVVARCVERFREIYAQTWNVHTKPYEGIPELLDALAARRLKTAVLSNKPDEFTKRCVDEYFGQGRFQAVLGQREGVVRKPDPAGALEIAQRLGVPPECFVYLGDTAVDMQTARSAGMVPVGALWGFRPLEELREGGARAVVRQPMELIGVLDGSAARRDEADRRQDGHGP